MVELGADGSLRYVPNENKCGEDSFTYRASDGEVFTDPTTVSISVRCVDDPPDASDDEAATDEDTSVTVDVLANDSDPDGDLDSTSVRVATSPGSGSAVLAGTSIEYTPDDDFFGSDSFTYEVCDLEGQCSTATVLWKSHRSPMRRSRSTRWSAPTKTSRSRSTSSPTTSTWTTTWTRATVSLVDDPSFGSALVEPDGSVTYTPDADRNGIDSFVYEVCDTTDLCDTATVTVSVRAVNDAPIASNDTASTTRDTPVTVDVLANDTDVESTKPTSSVVVIEPAKGTAVVLSDGSIRYTANPGECGIDTFTYVASDGSADSAPATVTITIDCPPPPPEAPDAVGDEGSTLEDTPVEIEVTANDVDPDGDLDTGSVRIVGSASFGTAEAQGNGKVTVQPGNGLQWR